MVTFTDAEPIVEPKKVAVKYRYYISIEAMTNLLKRFEYDPETVFVQNGWWDISKPPTYTDSIKYEMFDTRVSGIGFFESYTNKLPSIVMNVEEQKVYIIDDRHIKEVNEVATNKDVIFLVLTFDRVFSENCTWDSILQDFKTDK